MPICYICRNLTKSVYWQIFLVDRISFLIFFATPTDLAFLSTNHLFLTMTFHCHFYFNSSFSLKALSNLFTQARPKFLFKSSRFKSHPDLAFQRYLVFFLIPYLLLCFQDQALTNCLKSTSCKEACTFISLLLDSAEPHY